MSGLAKLSRLQKCFSLRPQRPLSASSAVKICCPGLRENQTTAKLSSVRKRPDAPPESAMINRVTGDCCSSDFSPQVCHPERSRSSGGAKDLSLNRRGASARLHEDRAIIPLVEPRSRALHHAGLESMFAGEALSRSPIRRQVFHRSSRQRCLLPLDLPRAHRERKKLPLLPHRRCRCRSGISSLSALPPRMLSRNARLDGYIGHRFPRLAAHRRKRS